MHIFAWTHISLFIKIARYFVLVGFIYCLFVWPGGSLFSTPFHSADRNDIRTLEQRVTRYYINASVPVLGKLASIGILSFEESLKKDEDSLEKILHLYGNTNPDMVAKGHDYSGDFKITKRIPLDTSGYASQIALEQGDNAESFYAGTLKRKEKIESETVIFYPDHVLATREDGVEKRIDGKFESPLGALEHFMEKDVKVGDIYESKFILNGYPYIFKCEVSQKDKFRRYGVSAYKVDVTTYDGLKKDEKGQPRLKKKRGGIRIWVCKEGKYKNRIIQLNIKYRWYLTLKCELKMVA